MAYGSFFYIAMLTVLIASAVGLWLILRHRSEKTCRKVILILMLINVAQHLLKPLIYPMYRGQGFSHIVTAYNMCATLILLSPIALLSKSRFLKNFVYFVGSVAGLAAIALPVWYIGKPISELGWDYARFYLCHALLMLTSLMSLVLGLHCPCYRELWHIGAGFLMALCIILLNDLAVMAMGKYTGADIRTFYQSMCQINPCGMMAPPEHLPWIERLVRPLSLSMFMGKNPAGIYIPILWYAIPLFLGMTTASGILFGILDRKHLQEDLHQIKDRIHFHKI